MAWPLYEHLLPIHGRWPQSGRRGRSGCYTPRVMARPPQLDLGDVCHRDRRSAGAASGFLPRLIGSLLAIGALSYLAYSVTSILSPEFASDLVPYIQLPSLIGEGSFCLWLLVIGVNAQRWNDRAGTSTLASSESVPSRA